MRGRRVAVIGAGPAGLMAAEVLAARGIGVDIYEALPSPGRKLLFAGKSGLNLTHAEPFERFLTRFGGAQSWLEPALRAFPPETVVAWAQGLRVDTFVGSSGRVFPVGFKAAPLLRAWLRRLSASGAMLHVRHRWTGWDEADALRFETPDGPRVVVPDATVLALGGASWPRLGSDGAWRDILVAHGVHIAPFRPANVGFEVAWSPYFRQRFAGEPLKNVSLTFGVESARGDVMVTTNGIEGAAVYVLSAALRDAIVRNGADTVWIDLLPDRSETEVCDRLGRPRGKRSFANHLRQAVGLTGPKAALLREGRDPGVLANPAHLAALIKRCPLPLMATRPIAEAISSAGGVTRDALTDSFMLRALPSVFCSGEMLDWEARTGGYLLTACFATGRAAGAGAADRLANH